MKRVLTFVLVCSIIGSIVLLAIAWQVYPKPLWRGLVFGTLFWISSFALVFYMYSEKKGKELRDRPIIEKINQVQKQGKDLHLEQETSLSLIDIKKIQSSIQSTMLFIIGVTAVFLTLIYTFFDQGLSSIIPLSAFLIIFFLIAYSSVAGLNEVIAKNKKIVIRGIITDERQLYTGSGKGRRMKYFKTIGTRELQVDVKMNSRYKLGDAVEIHYAVNRNMLPFILKDELLPEARIS